MKTKMGFAAFFCALSIIGLSLPAPAEEKASVFEGVMLTDLDGGEVAIDSLLSKGPLVINFWATWCSPCKREMPYLENLYREFGPQGVQFAAVSVDRKGHEGRVKSFLEKQKLTVPAYMDRDTKLAKGFQVRAIPTTLIILQDGSLHHRSQGYRPGDEVILRKHLQSLVEGLETPADDEKAEAGDGGREGGIPGEEGEGSDGRAAPEVTDGEAADGIDRERVEASGYDAGASPSREAGAEDAQPAPDEAGD